MRRLALLCLVLVACGDEGGPIPLDDLEGEVINTLCSLYVNCGLVDDIATCRKLQQGEGDLDASLLAAIEAGKVIYHPDKARECLNGVGGSCERGATLGTSSEACDETFEGTVGAGGQCALDEVCKSRDCDVPTCPDACCQGTCVGDAPIPRPTVGQSCAENARCIDSFCDFATTTCVAYRTEGEPCTSTGQCGTNVCANQTCQRRPGPGEPCDTESLAGQCSHIGYTCSASSLTCVPVGLSGDTCSTQSECSDIYNCDAGTCQLGPELGETCGELEGGCIDNSYCDFDTLTCTARKADGAMCNDDNECRSDYCDVATATCAAEPVCF
jgi:hypothetical protein